MDKLWPRGGSLDHKNKQHQNQEPNRELNSPTNHHDDNADERPQNEPTKSRSSPSSRRPQTPQGDWLKPISKSRLSTLAQIGEDWLYLALLGIIMALLSFSMDAIITSFLNTRLWLTNEMSNYHVLLQYTAWCVTPILLVTFSTGFVHLCSPTVSYIVAGPSNQVNKHQHPVSNRRIHTSIHPSISSYLISSF